MGEPDSELSGTSRDPPSSPRPVGLRPELPPPPVCPLAISTFVSPPVLSVVHRAHDKLILSVFLPSNYRYPPLPDHVVYPEKKRTEYLGS